MKPYPKSKDRKPVKVIKVRMVGPKARSVKKRKLDAERAMALPDGAVVSAAWGDDLDRNCYTVGSNDAFGVPKKFGGSTLERKEYWRDYRWHSVRLESLPEPAKPERPVYVSTCDRCGTNYWNNERHACATREPSEPSPGDGHRWVEVGELLNGADTQKVANGLWVRTVCEGFICEDALRYRRRIEPELDIGYRWVNIGERIIDTDEYLTSYGEWMQTGGLEFKCTVAKKYRRRIEPQAEPAKPERQASEIEKRAALALVRWNAAKLAVAAQSLPTMWDTESIYETSQLKNILDASDIVRESERYAKSIGAIE